MASNPGITQKKITIQNKYNEKLVGILHETGSPDIVVLCHGFLCTKNDRIMVSLAAALEAEGISAFRFDFAGNGESEGVFMVCCQRQAEDLRCVVQHFVGQNRKIAAILGHSKGGSVVLLYASMYHDVHTLVNVSGCFDFLGGLTEEFMERIKKDGFVDVRNAQGKVVYRFLELCLTNALLNPNMHDACCEIDKACRVLTIHGSNDEVNPIGGAFEFDQAIPNHKLHIVEGADHFYTSQWNLSELVSTAISFIKQDLQQN
ncbi:PREDICTED: uncharacterized protein LOC109148189 [Ipomoea nil]|uniref:uncharacterized protein LOC109148189 n=1 Tax=Ipomoea nil TaxID=35883 RepID=UPI0009016250|nr:PREDICTED: uncharacterized protein LOC109148189 [Ipomoea nil]XP_019151579.1 PREDICTED: uncharacterized protein LOC109148189 [Ipomoea nil]